MVKFLIGDCAEMLREHVPDASVDLIVTSPPYADARRHTYGGIAPDAYVEWFLPRSAEFARVLKPRGTFILNMKEKVVKGERSTYVLELILALRRQGWLWTEEYIWHKRNCYPGKWPNRFRDAWERLLQFNLQRDFAMYQEAVMVPVGDWATERGHETPSRLTRTDSATRAPFGVRRGNWKGRSTVLPTNVLALATESANVRHSAAFPVSLPDWFIRCFTQAGDMVLDPFAGVGTTALAAKRLGRDSIWIDTQAEYETIARARISP